MSHLAENTLFAPDLPQIASHYSADAKITLYLGDVMDLLRTMPKESVNLIVTSPPYNMGKEYENRVSVDAYLNNQKTVISELYRILRNDGSICWQVGNYVEDGEVYPLDILFYELFKKFGFPDSNGKDTITSGELS